MDVSDSDSAMCDSDMGCGAPLLPLCHRHVLLADTHDTDTHFAAAMNIMTETQM